MRKLVYATNTTLDGYMANSSGQPDFGDADDELHDFWTKELQAADTLLFGRVMYQMLEAYWPAAASDPSISQSDRAFADALNPMPKIVFSKTLDKVGWNTRVVRDNIGDEVRTLKEAPGHDLALSCGPDLLATFLELGLIDEIR